MWRSSCTPICYAIKNINSDINYIEAVSTISSASAGPATRKNISEYISSTEKAISQLLNSETVKIILNITPALPPIEMKTSILMKTEEVLNFKDTWEEIKRVSNQTRKYVKGYKNSLSLKTIGEKASVKLRFMEVEIIFLNMLVI